MNQNQEVHVIYGNQEFLLQVRALKRIKNSGNLVEKAAVDSSLTNDFSILRRFCRDENIEFGTGYDPENFILERGNGFYLTSDNEETPRTIKRFQERGFKVEIERVIPARNYSE